MCQGLTAALLVSALLGPGRMEAADLAAIKQRGSLRVLVMPMSAPDEFFCLECDNPGLDRELLEGFARLHGVKLEVVPIPGWSNLVPALLKGRGDVIAGRFTVTSARSRKIAFTRQVFPTRNVVLSRGPHRIVRTLEQLRRERVGTIKGTSMAEAVAAARVPASNIDSTIPPGGLPGALQKGKVTAVVLGIESAITAQHRDPKIQLGLFLGPPGSLAYGLRKQDASLHAALDSYIANVRRTATWSRLVVKYFGESALDILKKARTR